MILAAGKGTRLFPLTGQIPKPLAPVADTPIIGHIFDLLARHGIEEAYVNLHYLADALLRAYGEETHINGMRVNLVREKELTGTAGGVKHLAKIAPAGSFNETFIVVSGDALTDVDIRDLVTFHKEKGALATVALRRVYDTSEFGVVEVDEESNILSFQEKPDPREAISTLANTGIYVFEPEILEHIPEDTFFDFAQDVFPRLLEEGEEFVGYEGEFYWSDIGTLEAYRQAQYDVLSGRVEVKVTGKKRGESVWVGENAQVHPSASLEWCVVIGEDAVIGRDVVLSGYVVVGTDCWIRPNATIKRSILLPGANVGAGAYLEDCIVGYGYDVRAGETIRGGALITPSPEIS
jgi:mannose-1-phosphate guanylyltransferase